MDFSGDIILTRNTDAVGNNSPGWWNHSAISTGLGLGEWSNLIVEAQIKLGVAAFTVEAFKARYPRWCVIRFSSLIGDDAHGWYAAHNAIKMIGQPYARYGSIFLLRKGENCVSVVRKAWSATLGRNLRWRKPDHIYRDAQLGKHGFQIVAEHHDPNWVKPNEWFGGRVA